MMKFRGFLIGCIFFCSGLFSSETEQPLIRKASAAPFEADGNAVEEVWQKADILTGFSIPMAARVAIYQTRARILYDEENLYFHVEGDFEPTLEFCPPPGGKPFSQTCIEVLIRPNPAANDFYHIAVAPGSENYSAAGFRSVPLEGLKVWFFRKGSRIRITNLQVPLKSIDLEDTVDGKAIGFNVCGANFDLVEGIPKQSSSFAVLEKKDFRVPSTWRLARFSTEAGPGRMIRGHSENLRLNLIANSDFSYALPDNKGIPGWNIPDFAKHTFRKERMAMSNDWLISAGNQSFMFLRCSGQQLDPEKFYTMRVMARTLNGVNQLAIQQYARVEGKYRKLGTVTPRVSLSDKFSSFSFVFKPAIETVDFLFYRYGDRSEENKSCLEVSSVELYEGELASCEIRTVADPGLKALAEGTERPIPPNPMGRRKTPLKVLAFTWSEGYLNYMRAREILELFSKTGAEVDILCAQDESSDIFYTKNDPKRIQERLEAGNYDLYLLSGEQTLKRIGEKTAAQICENVEAGAVLVLGTPAKFYHFSDFFKQYPPQQVPEDDYLCNAFPEKIVKLESRTPPPYAKLAVASAGKGRLYQVNFAHPQNVFLPRRDVTEVMNPYFPFEDYASAWIARLLYFAAGKTPSPILSIQHRPPGFSITAKNTPDGTRVRWNILAATGRTLLSGVSEMTANRAEIQYPADQVPAGFNLLAVQTIDAAEQVLDYSASVFNVPGPILTLTSLNEYHADQEEGRFILLINGDCDQARITWKWKDFSGRIIESGTFNAAAKTEFRVLFQHVFTNFNTLSVDLTNNEKLLAETEFMVLVQDRDARRTFTDGFTLRMWGPGSNHASEATVREIDYQMSKIGVRIFCPTYTYEGIPSMGSGVAVGGIFLGGGDLFCGWPQKTNIRAQQFNTLAAREKIRSRAESIAQQVRKFGYTFACVCDEPNLSRPEASDELDSHPDNIAEFRKRMQEKHGTIAEFNRRMGASYTSFDELEPVLTAEARKTGRFGEFIEWRNFNVDRWCEIIKVMSDALKKHAPHARFALTNSFGQGIYSGNDYAKLYRKAGLDFATEYSSCIYLAKNPIYNFDEFMRSFNPEMLSWGSIGYTSTPNHISFSPWWFACHRYGGMGWYAATGAYWNMVDRPTLGLTKDAVLLGETLRKSRLQKGIGKLFLEYRWQRNDIAIYYSQTSMQVAFLLGEETRNGVINTKGPLHDYFYSRQGIQYALEGLLYQYDYVSADQVEDDVLGKGYKTLFLPSIISMSDKEIAAIQKFVAGGGKIIADFSPGMFDELGMKREQAPLPETILTGKIFSENSAGNRKELQQLLLQTSSQPVLQCEGVADTPGREAMHFTSSTNRVYAVIRNFTLSNDNLEQTFVFPGKGHVYDLRSQKYLGETDRVSCRVPNADAAVFGLLPYRIDALQIKTPSSVTAGTNLQAAIAVEVSGGKPGKHIFHVELENPAGENPVSLQRNLVAPQGQSDFVFRMAENDPKGIWILRVNDVLSGITSEKKFSLQ